MTAPSVVVFDLGGVLIDWNPRHHLRDVFAGDEAAMEHFLATICTPQWNERQDGGRAIADAEAELIALHQDAADLIRAYYAGFDRMMRDQIHGTVALLERLHAAGTPLYGLTNWSAETFPLGVRRFAFFRRFRGVVVSGEVKAMKPHRAIFDHLTTRFGLDPAACLFIDDSEKNVAGARAAGLHAVHFTSPGQLEADLVRHGLLPPG